MKREKNKERKTHHSFRSPLLFSFVVFSLSLKNHKANTTKDSLHGLTDSGLVPLGFVLLVFPFFHSGCNGK